MKVIHELKLDLLHRGISPRIAAVQCDSCSRILALQLFAGNLPWSIPQNVQVLIRYRKSDRTGGAYDTLPNGEPAWEVRNGRLLVTLAPQVLTASGEAVVSVTLLQGDTQLSTFSTIVEVQPQPDATALSENYYRVSAFLPQPSSGAKVGQVLQVTAVNEAGEVVDLEAVDPGLTAIDRQLLLQILGSASYTEDVSGLLAALSSRWSDNGGDASPIGLRVIYSGDTQPVGTPLGDLTASLTVYLHYADGTRRQLSSGEYTLAGNAIAAGDNTVTVRYANLTATFTVVGAAPTYYTVTNQMTNAFTNNTMNIARADSYYTSRITAAEGFVLESIQVLMGGEDVTKAVLSAGIISIAAVTGDVLIIATAIPSNHIAPVAMAMDDQLISVYPGEPHTIGITLYPEGASATLVWSTSDSKVAVVNQSGTVTFVSAGKCTITAAIPELGLSASCVCRTGAVPTDIMSNFKYLGPTTYSPGTYTAWCPTGLIYDSTRNVYAQFMNVHNRHYQTPNACELWFNTIDPGTLAHTKPVFIARTAEATTGTFSSSGALGCCIKDGNYYMFSQANRGYYKSTNGGATWSHESYEKGPESNPWGCYVLSNGRMIMGSDVNDHKVYYSDDNGKNWTTIQCEHFNEPTFVDFGNGVLMAICRENKDSSNNIQPPWMHVSYDNGQSWTNSVAMTSVGYMGNNNCNAYIHDNYVELFVGCRNWKNSPQWDGYNYKINQYVMDLSKGPVDEFEFVNTVYAFKSGENPQGNLINDNLSADEFSTPVIAIKDKAHALMMFYGPVLSGVTHHMIAVGNIPVEDYQIPSILPESYKASQAFNGTAGDVTITVCGSYDIRSRAVKGKTYPSIQYGYLNFSDIEDGGFAHVQVIAGGNGDSSGTSWLISPFVSAEAGMVKTAVTNSGLGLSPVPTDINTILRGGVNGYFLPALTAGEAFDRYAMMDGGYWWIYSDKTWVYIRSGDVPLENLTYTNLENTPEQEPFNKEGLTSYRALVGGNANLCSVQLIEYDKATT